MYQRILVALGEEDAINERVLAEAVAIAKPSQSTLNLIHVLLPPDSGLPNPIYITADGMHSSVNAESFQTYIRQWQIHQKENQHSLDEQANHLQEQGIATEWTQAVGDAGRQICKVAQDWTADLVMLGRHNRSGFQELWLGSVSNYVMHHAPCSVIVVQSPAKATES